MGSEISCPKVITFAQLLLLPQRPVTNLGALGVCSTLSPRMQSIDFGIPFHA